MRAVRMGQYYKGEGLAGSEDPALQGKRSDEHTNVASGSSDLDGSCVLCTPMTEPLSRRQFVTLATAGLVTMPRPGAAQTPATLTAQQIIDRIKSNLGAPWRDKTIDGIKAGDPATVVTGIVTTVAANLPVLRKAAAAGNNLVITQEPVFYSANDEPGNRAGDSVLLAKKKLIDDKHLVVFRLSDHWTARQPNAIVTALA